MRIKQTDTVTVEDLKLEVALPWSRFRQIQSQVEALPDPEEDVGPMLDYVEDILPSIVVSVEGLEDENGQAITELNQDVLDQLPTRVVMGIFRGVMNVGDEVNQGNA